MKGHMQSMPYRSDIDGLRAIAVGMVVAFHVLPARFRGGFIGVDVFFVISGFLITSIILAELRDNHFSLVSFYIRRIKRIFPALIITLLGTWFAGWVLLEPRAYADLGKNMLASAGFASNILLYSEYGYFTAIKDAAPLVHLWSLGVEEQFYILWPILLLISFKTNKNIAIKIKLLIVVSFVISVLCVKISPAAAFYLPFSRAWELLIGASLAYFCSKQLTHFKSVQETFIINNKIIRLTCADCLSMLGFALLIFGVFIINDDRFFPGYWALIPVSGAALLIFSGPSAWVNKRVLSQKWLVSIGLISYPLYLIHWPILIFSSMTEFGQTSIRLRIVLAVVAAILLSYFIYVFIERPLRSSQNALSTRVAKWAVFFMALVAALGFATSLNGMDFRYTSAARQFLNFSPNYADNFRNSKCLLSGSETVFSKECWQDRELPQLLIWGDSHGAMFYRSLSEVASAKGYGIAQYTSSSCPPFLEYEKKGRPLCKSINDKILTVITEIRPKAVLLAHDWPQSSLEHALANLPATVATLRQLGVANIILIGPVPRWTRSLPAAIVKYLKSSGADVVPDMLNDPANEIFQVKQIDSALLLLASELQIAYISPLSMLCAGPECSVWIQSKAATSRDITAFDDSHLTTIAAQALVEKNIDLLFIGTQ
jgi:peptidoglycan/LPS O-acetylase OafA/YrhL